MLKLTVMIECDVCHEIFNRVATSTDRDPSAWGTLPLLLETTAETSGWSIFSAHQCADCVLEIIGETELDDGVVDDTIPF